MLRDGVHVHPIDCPICEQAGECELQDYYMDHDRQGSRFPLEAKIKKRKATDIGPLVMLDQELCILCTRCTRFLEEVTKSGELGVFVNRRGRVQLIREAFPPPGQAKPGWRIIAELLEDVVGRPVPADASAVFTEFAAGVASFRRLSYEAIGSHGAQLERFAAERAG